MKTLLICLIFSLCTGAISFVAAADITVPRIREELSRELLSKIPSDYFPYYVTGTLQRPGKNSWELEPEAGVYRTRAFDRIDQIRRNMIELFSKPEVIERIFIAVYGNLRVNLSEEKREEVYEAFSASFIKILQRHYLYQSDGIVAAKFISKTNLVGVKGSIPSTRFEFVEKLVSSILEMDDFKTALIGFVSPIEYCNHAFGGD